MKNQFEQNDNGWTWKYIVYYATFKKKTLGEKILNIKKLTKTYMFGGFD